jgi:uncharacterized membrane protein
MNNSENVTYEKNYDLVNHRIIKRLQITIPVKRVIAGTADITVGANVSRPMYFMVMNHDTFRLPTASAASTQFLIG